MNTVYGIQQNEATLKQNISNWQALHTNKEDTLEAYKAEKKKKYKIRLIESWRKKGRA